MSAKGYYSSSTTVNVFIKCQVTTSCIGNDKCDDGYEGYLCGQCSDGYYRNGQKCYECDSFGDVLLWLCIIAVIVFIGIVFYFSYKQTMNMKYASLRIGWSYLQVTSLYLQFELNWPQKIKNIYNVLSFVILDIQITSPECSIGHQIGFYILFVVKMLIPLIFIILTLICYICFICYTKASSL